MRYLSLPGLRSWQTRLILLLVGLLLGFGASARGGHGFGRGWHGGGGFRGGWHPHGHSSFGFYFGPTWGWSSPFYYSPWWYSPWVPAPYYPYPSTVLTIPPSPPVYIEQPQTTVSPPVQPEYWQYCAESRGYYPYVGECPGGWQRIATVPPGQETGYWYQCANPRGYYPYVVDCPGGWKKAIPVPPSSQ